MGRQITVELQALQATGAPIRFDVEHHIMHGEDEAGMPTAETFTNRYLILEMDGVTVYSAYDDCLVFDCRDSSSSNFWMERWLIANKVPYLEG